MASYQRQTQQSLNETPDCYFTPDESDEAGQQAILNQVLTLQQTKKSQRNQIERVI